MRATNAEEDADSSREDTGTVIEETSTSKLDDKAPERVEQEEPKAADEEAKPFEGRRQGIANSFPFSLALYMKTLATLRSGAF